MACNNFLIDPENVENCWRCGEPLVCHQIIVNTNKFVHGGVVFRNHTDNSISKSTIIVKDKQMTDKTMQDMHHLSSAQKGMIENRMKLQLEKRKQDEMVKSPDHYAGPLSEMGIELIDVINAYDLNGNRSSIARYLFRAGIKDINKEVEDLEKIIEYAQFEIRRLQGFPVSRTRQEVTRQHFEKLIDEAEKEIIND